MSDPLLIILAMGGVVAATQVSLVGLKSWTRRARLRALRMSLARRFELTPGPRKTAGVKDSLALYIDNEREVHAWEGNLHVADFVLRSLGEPPFSERISFHSDALAASNRIGFKSGDPRFDAFVSPKGPEHILRAVLDARTRELLRQLVIRGHVEGAEIFRVVKISTPSMLFEDVDKDAALMFELAQNLSILDKRVAERILYNAREDPELGVRARCLATFAELYRARDDLPRILEAAMNDPAPRVQVEAALHMRPVPLEKLESWIDDVLVGPQVRRRALKGLATHAPKEQSVPRLIAALNDRELLPVAIWGLGAVEHTEAAPLVCEAAQDSRAEVQEAVAVTLGRLRAPIGEATLIELLFVQSDTVQAAAIKALGQAGTLRCLSALQKSLVRMPLDSPLKPLARQAIARVEHRGDATAFMAQGGLSIVEPEEEGQLSFVETVGALSDPADL